MPTANKIVFTAAVRACC